MIFQAGLKKGPSKAGNRIRWTAVERPSGYTRAFISVLPHSLQAVPVPLVSLLS